MQLTAGQKEDLCLLVGLGCQRHIAAGYFGCRSDELRAELAEDEQFARALVAAESKAEVGHLQNVKLAAKEGANWRASAWWLERHAPDRYAKPASDAIPRREFKALVATLAAVVAEEVQHEEDRRRLLKRLTTLNEAESPPRKSPEAGA